MSRGVAQVSSPPPKKEGESFGGAAEAGVATPEPDPAATSTAGPASDAGDSGSHNPRGSALSPYDTPMNNNGGSLDNLDADPEAASSRYREIPIRVLAAGYRSDVDPALVAGLPVFAVDVEVHNSLDIPVTAEFLLESGAGDVEFPDLHLLGGDVPELAPGESTTATATFAVPDGTPGPLRLLVLSNGVALTSVDL